MSYPIVLISQLFQVLGNVKGRKKIQKIVYLLQAFGAPEVFRFRFHLYGPYSNELQDKLDFYVEQGLLSARSEQAGEFPTSRFEATPKMNEVLAKAPKPVPSAPWESLALELNQRTTPELEAISSMIFLQEAGKSGPALQELFCELKPQFCTEFDRYFAEAEAMRSRYGSGVRSSAA